MKLKNLLKKLVLGYTGNTASFSQAGEDLILKSLLNFRQGTYVDVGAYHPTFGSNTFFFYKFLGWSGINIDARPGSMSLFEKTRPRDKNLEIGISGSNGILAYYNFPNVPNMNTFDAAVAEERARNGRSYEIIQVPTAPLGQILEKNLAHPTIDLLSVDVEGLEYEVLSSNYWEKFRPKVVLIEEDKRNFYSSPAVQLLLNKGYEFVSLTSLGKDFLNDTYNLFFVDKHQFSIEKSLNHFFK